MSSWCSRALAIVAVLAATACSVEAGGLGAASDDAGSGLGDAGGALDATLPRSDAGRDGGDPRGDDAGPPMRDGGTDAGPPPPVDAGPCPGDGDDDGDGVCNSTDACPGQPDGVDEDGDAVPDGCDPCSLDGPSAAPIALPVSADGIIIDDVQLNGVERNVLLVDPGASVSVRFDYSIEHCSCSTCRVQLEVGFVPGADHEYCAYDGVPACVPDTGSDSMTVTAPATPGEYYLRFGKRLDYGCFYTHGTWWHGTPPPGRTFGAICVR